MAKKVVAAEIEIKTANSIADLKALKKQLKDTAAGSEEFKKLYNQIDDLEDKIKGSKKASSDWIDTLESAGGPLGMVGSALNKAKVATQSFGGALKATGIGLFVSAIGMLVAAFSQNEGAMKKFQPLLIGLEKILNGVLKALNPIIDGFISFATDALPYVSKAIGTAYSAITSFLQGIGLVGSALKKFISGDFSGAWDDAKKSVTEFGKRYEDSNKRFVEGTKEVTKIEQEELDKRKLAREKAAADAKAAADKEAARLKQEAEDKLKKREHQQELDIADAEYLKGLEDADALAVEKKAEDKEKIAQKDLDRDIRFANDKKKNQADLNSAILVADQQLEDAKYGIAEAGLNILGSLAGENEKLANALFVVDKAMAIAKIVVNTQSEIAGYWSNPLWSALPDGGITVKTAASTAAKIRAGIGIATIAATAIAKFKGGGGGASGSMGGASGGGSVSAPLLPQASTTTLNQGQVNQIGNVAARAFVVESDVTGNQERIQRLNRAARIN